ncbi:MAG: peptidoglycan-associated lipoprotein Pal [Thiolinea sp.]
MNIKLVVGLMIAGAALASGCSTQNKKPGPELGGSLSDMDDPNRHNHGDMWHSHNNVPGHGHNRDGSMNSGQGGSGSGSANGGGSGQGGSGQGGSGQSGGGFAGGQGGSANNGGDDYARDGMGSFGGGSAYGGNTKSSYTPADLRDAASILAQRIIYFGYNQSGIEPQYREILDAHASLLRDFPQLNVRLEGHADERGSREYNVALSERRAYAVRDYMQVKGVNKGQMDVVGYGEEVPAVFGHGEGSWSKNRRVEIIYAGE